MGKALGIIFKAAVAASATFFFGPAGGFTFGGLVPGGIGLGTSIALSAVGSAALGALELALAPTPKVPNFTSPSFQVQSRDNSTLIRQPITERRVVIGEARVSGPLVFLESTDDNQFHHMVIPLSDGEVDAIKTVYLGTDAVYDTMLDGSGNVTSGKYANLVRIKKHLGASGQAADSDLTGAITALDGNFKGTDVAYIYVRTETDRDIFPNVIPTNISAWVRGAKLFDPRDGTTRWQPSPALAARLYLTNTRWGRGVDAVNDLDDATTMSAANTCDEFVATTTTTVDLSTHVVTATAASDLLITTDERAVFQTGDRVQGTTTGTLPAGLSLATNYYVIAVQEVQSVDSTDDDAVTQNVTYQLATTYDNALTGTQIDITDAGTGTHTLTKNGEPRYTANGVIDFKRSPAEALEDLKSAMAGRIYPIGPKWTIDAGVYVAPTVTLDESDMRGSIRRRGRHSRRERFNAVKGIYVSPLNAGIATDYPPVTDSTFQTNDGGSRVFAELDLPFTSRSNTAQRLAKIALQRHRQEQTIELVCSMAAFQLQAGGTFALDNTRRNWSAKVFEIAEWVFTSVQSEEGPAYIINLIARETVSTVFDFNATAEETAVDPAPRVNPLDPTTIGEPSAITITEELYNTRNSAGVKARANVTWTAATDKFVDEYQVSFKLTTDTTYLTLAATPGLKVEINDLNPGRYDFKVQSVNQLGVRSDGVVITQEILGLLSPPTAPQGVTIFQLGGIAILQWDQSPDLDVLIGGDVLIRHATPVSGVTWQTSTSLSDPIPGDTTVAFVPLKVGTYLLRTRDSSGILSTATTSITSAQATILAFTNTDTITESTAFTGTHASTIEDGGLLKLVGQDNMDDWADVDLVADWDSEGGVALSGTYTFAARFDFGSVVQRRLTNEVAITVVNVLDQIDSRTSLIDTWDDFDGNTSGFADLETEFRTTQTDPTGAPVWTDWNRFSVTEVSAWGVEMRAQLLTTDPAYNVHCTKLEVVAARI